MAVRLVISMQANPGRSEELAAIVKERCLVVQQESGCQQFEVFQSALDPDRLVLLELWESQEALGVHARLNTARPPAGLLVDGPTAREDYEYNRTR
jgi:quinol monooxygenase YgiN